MSLQNGFTILRHDQQKIILGKLKGKKGIAYYRKGSFSDELIWQNRKFLFPSPKKEGYYRCLDIPKCTKRC